MKESLIGKWTKGNERGTVIFLAFLYLVNICYGAMSEAYPNHIWNGQLFVINFICAMGMPGNIFGFLVLGLAYWRYELTAVLSSRG